MGYIRKKGPKTWQATADLGRESGSGRRQRRSKNFTSERDARRWIREQESLFDRGLSLEDSKITVTTYFTDWLKAYRAYHAPTTARNVALHVERRIIPALGALRLRELNPQKLMAFYTDIPGRTMPYRVHVTMRKALDDAVKSGLIQRNPAAGVVPPRQGAPAPPQWWSAEELSQFLAVVRDDDLYALWRLYSLAGLRRGEGLGLHWPDLNLAGRQVTVRRNLSPFGMGAPKTKASRRTVDVDEETVEALHEHWRRQRQQEAAGGVGWSGGELVFCQPDGQPYNPEWVSLRFRRILQENGLRRIKLHELRDTHASLLLINGVHLKVVQERLGHSMASVTLERYGHIMPSMGKEAAKVAAGLVGRDSADLAKALPKEDLAPGS